MESARPSPLRNRRILRWASVVVWGGVIFAWSAVPGSNLPGGPLGNLAHVAEYTIFGALILWALELTWPTRHAAIAAIALASAYGVSDEFHQSFVPMRTPDPADWARDTLGAAIGVGLVLLVRVVHRRLRGQRPQ